MTFPRENPPPPEMASETHNDNTMLKVYNSLRRAGLSDQQVNDAVNQMQNDGILFREMTDGD